MPSGGLFASVVAPIIGGVAGQIMSGDATSQQQAAQIAALRAYQGIDLPSIAAMQVNPSMESVQGQVSPQMQQLVQQNSNAYQGIQTDPRLVQAQMQALGQLQQQGQGGLTATEKNVLQSIQNQTAGNQQAANKTIMANMAARGMGGSGAELAAQLSGSQSAANQGNQSAMNLASQSQQNALQSMMGAGQMGGSMQAQQFAQQAAQAQAQNAISQFNTANRQNVNAQNTSAANQAQYYNQQNAQNVANANTGATNQSKYYNSNLNQTQFQDAMGRAGGISGGNQNLANYYGNQANATRGMASGAGNAIGSAGSTYAANAANQPLKDAQINYYDSMAGNDEED